MKREIPGEWMILGEFNVHELGRFVAKNEEAALDMLARIHGHENADAAEKAKPGWRRKHSVWPAVERVKPRPAKTDINAILDTVLLTDEDEGTTGHLLRLALYRMAGTITEADVEAWLAAARHDSDDEEEVAHFRNKMLALVHAMRADALAHALRDVGMSDLGMDVSMSAVTNRDWQKRDYATNLERVAEALSARAKRSSDQGEKHYLRLAQKALAEAKRLKIRRA